MSIKEGRTLLHNPRCSKCRIAMAMMEESGVEFTAREYLLEPLTREELDELHELLGSPPIDWIRTGEVEWGEANLGPGSSDDEILQAIAKAPRLLQRPILISGGSARVGRPPELLREMLEG